jgi:hypothetical protein
MAETPSSELTDKIQESATDGIAKASGDTGSVEKHKLSEQIAADSYTRATKAAKRRRRGIRFSRAVPPGTV